MIEIKKFFRENVELFATSKQKSLEYNEQRGFLAMSEAIEQIQWQLNQIDQELVALRQEIRTLSDRID